MFCFVCLAVSGNIYPNLEHLNLSNNNRLSDEGIVRIASSLEANKRCMGLRQLHLERVGMGPVGGAALTKCVASGCMRRLHTLALDYNQALGLSCVSLLIKALDEGRHGHMRVLSVRSTGIQQSQALSDMVGKGTYPGLSHMNIII